MAKMIYGDLAIELGAISEADAKRIIVGQYPEVASAEQYTDANGDVRFRVSGGTKGLR